MTLRICDTSAKPLKACASFRYRGHWVSASTVFAPQISVFVFESQNATAPVSPEFSSVEAAIRWIDARLDGEA